MEKLSYFMVIWIGFFIILLSGCERKKDNSDKIAKL